MRLRGRTLASAALAICAVLAISASPALGAKKKPKKLGKVTTVTATGVSAGASEPLTVTATCPGSKKAVGGGWTVTPAGFSTIFVFQSQRGIGENWTTTARTGLTAGIGLTTYVYCRKVKKPIVDATGTALTPATSTGQATATATCPSKHKLISGGFASSQGNTTGDVSYPLASFKSGNGWTYTAQNNQSSSQTLTSHAYCLKLNGLKNSSVKTQTGSQTLASTGEFTVSTPSCTKKKPRLGAGGFSNVHAGGGVPFVNENRANGASWLVTARNVAVQSLVTVTAQGLCLQK